VVKNANDGSMTTIRDVTVMGKNFMMCQI
jgi:hypothetical protein